MAAPVGQLAVRLTADTGDFRRKLSAAEKSLGRLGREMRGAINVAGKYAVALGAVGAAISVNLVGNAMKAIDRQSKLARQLGITQAEIAGMTLAADLAGVSQQKLEKNIQAYNKRLGEAIGGTGEAKDALEKMGMTAEELARLPLPEQMARIADAINGMGTQAEKAAALSDLFSRAGLDMFNLFEGGGEALRQATAEAEKFGLTISDIEAVQVEAANDAITRASAAVRGLSVRAAADLAPAIEAAANHFSRAAVDAGNFSSATFNVARSIGTVGGFVLDSVQGIRVIFKSGEVAVSAFNAVLLTGLRDVGKSIAFVLDSLALIPNKLIKVANMVKGVDIPLIDSFQESRPIKFLEDFAAAAQENLPIVAGELKNLAENATTSRDIQAIINKIEEDSRALAEKIRAERRDIQAAAQGDVSGGPSEGEQDRLDALRKRFEVEREIIAEHEQAKADLKKLFAEGELGTEQEQKQILQDLEQTHMERLKQIRMRGLTDMERFQKMSLGNQVKTVIGDMANMTQGVAQQSRKMFELNKALALANTAVNLPDAIVQSYRNAGGYPFGIPAALAMAATGMAQINAIRSQSFGGGGGISASAGGGGPASASATSDAAPSAQGSQPRRVFVEGIDPGSMFSGRQLIEILNEAQMDGPALITVAR